MPIFRNRAALEVARNIKIFLSLEVGITRGMTPAEQLARKNEEIATLKRKLAQARTSKHEEVAIPHKKLVRSQSSVPRLEFAERDASVFFVVGHQKSGTTWLMKMLDAHPEILCMGEGRPFGREWRQDQLKELPVSYPPASLYNAISGSENLRYWVERSVWTRSGDAEEHLRSLTRLAIEHFLTQWLSKTGKKLVGDKTILLSPDMVKEIAEIYPDAKVIHIIRDGRDVATSTMHHLWNQAEDRGGHSKLTLQQQKKREAYRENPQKLVESGGGIFPKGWLKGVAANWSVKVGQCMKDGLTLLGDNYLEVYYEDLLVRPEEEMRRLLRFLGADTSEENVRQCVSSSSFEKLSKGRKRGREAASFYRKGVAGDWKNVFTKENEQDFEEAAGELLLRLGYEKNNSLNPVLPGYLGDAFA